MAHYLQCPVLLDAVAAACGPVSPAFGLVAEGMAPQWKHLAVAAEVSCVTSHPRSAEDIAEMVFAADGAHRIQASACMVSTAAAELPSRRRGRMR